MREGLGSVLLQDNKPVLFVSHMLTDTERRYSQMETEFLRIVFGLTRLSRYLHGLNFDLETDSKPITQLFTKPIDSLSNRLQRGITAIQHFGMNVVHIKGTENFLADALSRNSVSGSPSETKVPEYSLCFVLKSIPEDLKAIAETTSSDDVLVEIAKQIANNWKRVSPVARPSFQMKDELCVKECKGLFLICEGSQVVIRKSLRSSVL